MDTFFKAIGVLVVSLLILSAISFLTGWVIMLVINYVFAPTFLLEVFGIAQLTFWKAYWFSYVCGLLTMKTSSSKEK